MLLVLAKYAGPPDKFWALFSVQTPQPKNFFSNLATLRPHSA